MATRPIAYFKAPKKKPRKLQWLLLTLGALFLFWSLLLPSLAGTAGRLAARTLFYAFGKGAFAATFLLGYCVLKKFLSKDWPHAAWKSTSCVLLVWIACQELSHLSQLLGVENMGGFVGKYSFAFFQRAMGPLGAFLMSLTISLLALRQLLDVSFGEILGSFHDSLQSVAHKLSEDWHSWKDASTKRRLLKKKTGPAIITPEPPQIPVAPRVVAPPPPREQNTGKEKPGGGGVAPELKKMGPYQLPPLDLLTENTAAPLVQKEEDLVRNAGLLEKTLLDFGIEAKVTDIHPGPVVTRYDLSPAPGVKVGSISALANDIALAMRAQSIRVLAPIPGKAAVGIEIPNSISAKVSLREIAATQEFQSAASRLSIGLGKTTEGKPTVADLGPMPHLLIAGATGSGKSVCIHSLMVSWLYKASPQEVKFLLIDPKRLELPAYSAIPHLYDPRVLPSEVKVVTNAKEASKSLDAMVKVMEQRYEEFAKANVRNIDGYNQWAEKNNKPKAYYIVVVIDELADLMMVAPKEVEDSIQRLAQMSRAVGIHLVLATQRPSVDVITGVIKANLPSRIAFQVLSKIDSRVILDAGGAEDLLGRGDMLFLPSGAPKAVRLQGAFVTAEEVEKVVGFVAAQGKPDYVPILKKTTDDDIFADEESSKDLETALKLVLARKRVSQDLLKAHFGSSARATNILSLLEVKGFIHKPEGSNRWEIFFDRMEDYLDRSAAEPVGREQSGADL